MTKPGAGCRKTSWLPGFFYSVPLEGCPQATTLNMTTYTWDEAKRQSNLRKHGLDFADAPAVIDGPGYTTEDVSLDYGEQRYVMIGFLNGREVVVVYKEDGNEVRIISFREATGHERRLLFRKR
jgi:hypothetical protein